MHHFAVAAIGRDRPGIVAAVTRVLLDHGVNVEDSQMTILRGHFTMTLIVEADESVDPAALRTELEAVARDLGLEAMSVSEVPELGAGGPADPTHIVTVYGADHPGIVHAVAAALAEVDVNITDLNTRLVADDASNGDGADLYAMMLEVALPPGVDTDALDGLLAATRQEQGVEITIRELEQDAL
jgi:glycine cleavage system transcriptional repressor